MVDRVQVQKWESVGGGGTDDEPLPGQINPNEDGLDCRSVFIQNDSSKDSTVEISRDGSDNMTFKDPVTGTTYTLSQLTTGGSGLTEGAHKILRQLIHFIDNGPAEGFASGAYREMTGTVFPTAVIWYTDSGKTSKIVEKNITWTGVNPTTIEWRVYDTDGSTVLATVSDSITYSGIFETSRVRTIS